MYTTAPQTDLPTFLAKQQPAPHQTLVLFGAEASAADVPVLQKLLTEHDIPYFGALFPQVISETASHETGWIFQLLDSSQPPVFYHDLGAAPTFDFHTVTDAPGETWLVLVDGLSANLEHFLRQVHQAGGNDVNYLGGGAGSLTLQQKPCLFSAEGFFDNCAVILPLALPCRLGVRHGWERVAGPYIANRTEANVIHELNWEPAFEVYRSLVEPMAETTFDNENFFSIAKGFPFGMAREGAEYVVRDPISTDANGALVCVGEVPENAVLEVMRGEPDQLIAAAGQAARDCTPQADESVSQCLVFDCISRILFLGDRFTEELSAVQDTVDRAIDRHQALAGALTLGEISYNGDGLLEFFNKTLVMGLFYDHSRN